MCTAFSSFVVSVALLTYLISFTTAEWPDIQLNFDAGGGRCLERKMRLALPLDVHTCQWGDCRIAFGDLDSFTRHLREGTPEFLLLLDFLVLPGAP